MTIGYPTIKLSNGVEMPILGLGTWQSSPEEVKNAAKEAIKAGYRLIDTAMIYGNETQIGEALKECIAEGIVKREDMFITTKNWVTHLHPEDIEGSLRESLKRLQLDFVDLYLSHAPTARKKDLSGQDHTLKVEENWKGMEAVYRAGLTRAIGVSNYSTSQIERVMKIAEVPIHNQQIELHLYWPQIEQHETCKKHNISLTSFSTLGSPGRKTWVRPDGSVSNYDDNVPADMDDPFVQELAKKYNKSPAHILLRWAIERNIAVIPKSVTLSRIRDNFNVFDFKLTDDEMKKLNNPLHKHRLFMNEPMTGHPEDSLVEERKK
ncbi:unnamed protein product, partial [Mesorhabditis belari]|uniref:NADP-dependent oxidoreductase domain-containing protein n=1 Tax=Mesorhabditis belari TaxID=2138241 RepID=A0AAF3FL68_9BILA